MLENLLIDEKAIWRSRNLVLQKDSGNTMGETRKQRRIFKENGNKKVEISETSTEKRGLAEFDTNRRYRNKKGGQWGVACHRTDKLM